MELPVVAGVVQAGLFVEAARSKLATPEARVVAAEVTDAAEIVVLAGILVSGTVLY